MASTISIPALSQVQTNVAEIAKHAVAVATAAVADIEALQASNSGRDWKDSVRLWTNAALPANTRTGNVLLADANGALNDTGIDGKTDLAVGQRIGVKNEVTGANNGLYTITTLGAAGSKWSMTRSTDADSSAEVTTGMVAQAEEGTANASKYFELTTLAITLNTTALVFAPFAVGLTQASDLVSTANAKGASLVGVEDAAGRITATLAETALAELAGRVANAAADETAIKAIPAAARVNGQIAVDLTNDVEWIFDSGSAAGASAWVLVPDAGAGRWLRNNPSLVDLSTAGSATLGANLIGLRDVATIYTATTVEDALAEVKVLADAGMPVLKKTLTSDHTTLVAAAATETVNIGTALPANARIVGVDMHTMTAFSGGTVGDFTVDIGTAGDVDALIDGADLFAAAVDDGPSLMPLGIRPDKFFAAGGQLIATFRCGSDDVADATAGAVTIDVTYVVLA